MGTWSAAGRATAAGGVGQPAAHPQMHQQELRTCRYFSRMGLSRWWAVARGWLCMTVFARQQQTGQEAHPARSGATAAGVTPAEPGAFIPNISAHLKTSPECFPLATGILGGRSSAARAWWADSCPPDRSRNEGRCCQLLACLGPCPAPTPGWGLLSFLSILSQCVFRLFILQKTD